MEILENCELKMEQSIENLKGMLNTLRTGRASAALLDKVTCDYYGERTPIRDICMISVPEPRQLLITPYDAGDVKTVVAGINQSEIGINPNVDGKSIRLIIPPLTEDRRRDIAKKSKVYGEECKVAIRNARRDAMEAVKKDSEYTEDTRKKEEEAIQKLTDNYIKKVDDILKEKEKEIMSL